MESSIETLQRQWGSISQYFDATVGYIIAWGPKLIAALVVLLIAYLVARGLSYAVRFGVDKTNFGKRALEDGQGLGRVISQAVFWVVILISLPAVLGTLGLDGLLEPMQSMAERFLAYLPNLVGAALVFGIGWAVASVVKRAVTSVLAAARADSFAERFGLAEMTGKSGLSSFAGTLVFALVIIPVAIAALDALAIQSIAAPAKQMLTSFLNAIPNIFAATIVLFLAYVIGRFASDTLKTLLPTTGVDTLGERIGLSREVLANQSVSTITGYVAFAAIMIFGAIEAAKLLNFSVVSNLLTEIVALGGHILLGSVIIVVGVVIADFIYEIVKKSKDAKVAAGAIKIAIIILATAVGLRQMGLANEIINTGFSLLMGALAVGAAIAIGWGGKDTAGRLLEKWTRNL